jgi:hypothetical protein
MRKLAYLLILFLTMGILPTIVMSQATEVFETTIQGLYQGVDGKFYASSRDTLYVFAKYRSIVIKKADGKEKEQIIRVREIKVKVDDGEWEAYTGNSLRGDFELKASDGSKSKLGAATGTFSIADEGTHTIYCFATDELGNIGPEVRVEVIIDNTCPDIDYEIQNDETVTEEADFVPAHQTENGYYVCENNKIFIYGYDLRSGIKKIEDNTKTVGIEYFNNPDNKWVVLEYDDPATGYAPKPISISKTGWSEGWNLIRCKATDNVENKTNEHAIKVFLDTTPPEITIRPVYGHLATAEEGSYPSIVTGVDNEFHIMASDDGSGLRNLKIFISDRNNEIKTIDDLKALDEEDWDLYSKPIKFFMTGDYYIYGRAVDNVGNPQYSILLHARVSVKPPTPEVRSGKADSGKTTTGTTTAPTTTEDDEDEDEEDVDDEDEDDDDEDDDDY